jgi:hypothetical protein
MKVETCTDDWIKKMNPEQLCANNDEIEEILAKI